MAISFITENYRIKLKLENTAFFKFRVIQSWRERQTKIDSGDSGFAEMIIKDNSVFAEKINKDKWGGTNVETSGISIFLSIITIDLLAQAKRVHLRPFVEIDTTQNNNCADIALQSKDSRHGQSSMGQKSSQYYLKFTERASFYYNFMLAVSYFFSLCLTVTWSRRGSLSIQKHEEKVSHTDPLLKLRAGVDWNEKY